MALSKILNQTVILFKSTQSKRIDCYLFILFINKRRWVFEVERRWILLFRLWIFSLFETTRLVKSICFVLMRAFYGGLKKPILFFGRSFEKLSFVSMLRARFWTLFIGSMRRSRVGISILFIFGRGALNLNVHYSYISTGIKITFIFIFRGTFWEYHLNDFLTKFKAATSFCIFFYKYNMILINKYRL